MSTVSKRSGRLYRSAGASHPEAIPARGEFELEGAGGGQKINIFDDLLERNPLPPETKIGWTAPVTYLVVLAPTMVAGIADSLLNENLTWITRITFLLACLLAGLRTAAIESWAAWTAPPIGFALAVIAKVNITGAALGGFVVTQLLGLAIGLSEHVWVVLLGTAAAWLLSRRHQVAYARRIRQQRRATRADS